MVIYWTWHSQRDQYYHGKITFLQKQWINQDLCYKREYCWPHPPFPFFVDYVCCNAVMSDDFLLQTSKSWRNFHPSSRNSRPLSQSKSRFKLFNPISFKDSSEYIARQCPTHNRVFLKHLERQTKACANFSKNTCHNLTSYAPSQPPEGTVIQILT